MHKDKQTEMDLRCYSVKNKSLSLYWNAHVAHIHLGPRVQWTIEYQNLHDSPEKQAAGSLNIDNINITFLISRIAEF